MATILGSNRKNKLKGKSGSDWIFGLLGNDVIDGRAGDDRIYGHAGKDKLTGGIGDDLLEGGLGKDRLYGGDEDDRLYGGDDNDLISGGKDNDYLSGDKGRDRLSGDDGNDVLYGGDDNDRLSGGDGNDNLQGGDGADRLVGGDGNDRLNGGSDEFRDVLSGGDGKDYISAGQNDAALGGKGIDTLDVSVSLNAAPATVNFGKVTGKKAASIGAGGVKAGQFEKVDASLWQVAAGSKIIGSRGDDSITVSHDGRTVGTILVSGGKGNDTLYALGSAGNIILNGGSGDDWLGVSSDGNSIIGGRGTDLFAVGSFGSSGPGTIADAILDFTKKDHILVSENNGFYNLDLRNPFIKGPDPVANSAQGQLLYDIDDGRLLYDSDGVGLNDPRHIATIANRADLKLSSFIFDF